MQSKVNYTIVGIFVVVLTFFLFLAIVWMSSIGHGKEYKTYWVYVHEDVTGLSIESPVRFNGVKVGYVKSMQLDDKNSKLVKLVLRIDRNVAITTSTYAILNAQGLTGVVYVNLKAQTEKAPLLIAQSGEPCPVIPSRPSLLMQLSEVIPEITGDIQRLSFSIAQVLDVENRYSIKDTLKNMNTVSKTLANNSSDFTASMQSLRNALFHISQVSDDLPDAMKQLNSTLASVNQLSIEAKRTAKTITSTMIAGQNVIHSFSTQVMPTAQETLGNISAATKSVNRLAGQLQHDPSMLVRGRAPQPLGPGE